MFKQLHEIAIILTVVVIIVAGHDGSIVVHAESMMITLVNVIILTEIHAATEHVPHPAPRVPGLGSRIVIADSSHLGVVGHHQGRHTGPGSPRLDIVTARDVDTGDPGVWATVQKLAVYQSCLQSVLRGCQVVNVAQTCGPV